jgi:hypothetical protein
MIGAQQLGSVPITGQQVPTVSLQAGSVPATVGAAQLDINSIFNIMILLVVVVMMMKMMTKATGSIE